MGPDRALNYSLASDAAGELLYARLVCVLSSPPPSVLSLTSPSTLSSSLADRPSSLGELLHLLHHNLPSAPLFTSFPPAVTSRARLAGCSPHYFILLLFSHPWVPRAPTSFVNFGNVAATGAPFSSHQLLSSFAFGLLSPQLTKKKTKKRKKTPPQMSSPSLAL